MKGNIVVVSSVETGFNIVLSLLVVPATPIIIQIVDSPLFKTTIHWKKQTAINETYCEERYKEKTGETWQVRQPILGFVCIISSGLAAAFH